jgi:hypothetical protein
VPLHLARYVQRAQRYLRLFALPRSTTEGFTGGIHSATILRQHEIVCKLFQPDSSVHHARFERLDPLEATTVPHGRASRPTKAAGGSHKLTTSALQGTCTRQWRCWRTGPASSRRCSRDTVAITAPQHCAYPGCDQPPATRVSDRGAKPKYCDDPDHNPLSAHRERRRRDAEASGQRTKETGGQPVTFGIARASELFRAVEKLTVQGADTLTRAIAELRAIGDIESAEAEVYAARTSADQRVATAEARLAEEIQRRRDAEAEREDARADREQADDATA